eukprot:3020061-Prymnesium_polylepis.1
MAILRSGKGTNTPVPPAPAAAAAAASGAPQGRLHFAPSHAEIGMAAAILEEVVTSLRKRLTDAWSPVSAGEETPSPSSDNESQYSYMPHNTPWNGRLRSYGQSPPG